MTAAIQAYQFALDPTPEQEAMLRSHCGAQRYAYNWGLARIKANLGQREAEKTYEVTADDLTPPLSWSAWSLRKDWNEAKGDVAPWWAENSKEAYAAGLANLSAGLQNWKDSKSGRRKGPKVRFPRFKGKRAGLSCRSPGTSRAPAWPSSAARSAIRPSGAAAGPWSLTAGTPPARRARHAVR